MHPAKTEACQRFLHLGEGSGESRGKESRDRDGGTAFQSGLPENSKFQNRSASDAVLGDLFGSGSGIEKTGQPGLEPGIAGFGDRRFREMHRSTKPNAGSERFKGKAKGKNRRRNPRRVGWKAEGLFGPDFDGEFSGVGMR